MKTQSRQSGLTLTEMTAVIAAMALLVSLAVPAIRAFFNSFECRSGARAMISAVLASARAIAAKEHRYAGIRFQQDLAGSQYIIFIVHEEPMKMGNLSNGFRAVQGLKPIKLPDSIGVIDLKLGVLGDRLPDFSEDWQLRDTTTFSIIFSPSGKLIIHEVRVRNRDGVYQPNNDDDNSQKHSMDDIFNSPYNISKFGIGKFVQDDYPEFGFGPEPSRNRFVIYDKNQFGKLDAAGRFNYLDSLEIIYINPYTGTIINQ